MSVTLEPVFNALGYDTLVKQRSLTKLLQAAGAFGQLPDVKGVLNDKQADAILHHVSFDNVKQAAEWLHDLTQETMLRPDGLERTQTHERPEFEAHRTELIDALRDAGMLSEAGPKRQTYDHVLLLGSKEPMVETRLDTVRNLWEQGVIYGKIHLLGSDRPLDQQQEPIANIQATSGDTLLTETQMLKARYYDTRNDWPDALKAVPTYAVNSYDREGHHANTKETIETWLSAQPTPDHGSVLVISNQPYVAYQDAAVKSVLPEGYQVDTVGAPIAEQDVNIALAMDALARQIDVNFDKLVEKSQSQSSEYAAGLITLDPDSIKSDPATYQFRSHYDPSGVTDNGRYQAERWDHILHGDPLLVHERLDGSYYVADGHHRLELAKRLNHQGNGPGRVVASILREADGYTSEDVKIIAAYKNIAHGTTDPIETARVFKEAYSGKVHAEFLPQLQMDKGNLTLSFQMSKLSDAALNKVEHNGIPAELAADVAARVADPKGQESVMDMISEEMQHSQTNERFTSRFASKKANGQSFAERALDTKRETSLGNAL
jgi:hypothetical protein